VGPAPAPPPPADPDRNTADVAEAQGLTESRFFAGGSGFGTRVLYANGILPAVPAAGIGGLAPYPILTTGHVNSKCGFTDRELVAGRVVKAEYDSGSTAAEAVPIAVDDRTKLDLERPSRCDLQSPSGSAVFKGFFSTVPAATNPLREAFVDNPEDGAPRWNHSSASCASSEGDGGAEDTRPEPGEQDLGTSRVSCPPPGGRLTAEAVGRLVGPLHVGNAASHVTVSRNPAGVHVTTTAYARDIGIENGLVQIAEIRATATSTSNGRPKAKPMSTFAYSIKGLRVRGTEVCSACDPTQAVDILNSALAGRAQFRLAMGVDDRLVRGTPKGALTAVQKSPERQASDQALVGDYTTEIPVLEMINYHDNSYWGRARQIYQFAGVTSVATYNISLVPTGVGLPGEGGIFASPVEASGLPAELGLGNVPASAGFNGTPAASTGGDAAAGGHPLRRMLRAVARGLELFTSRPREALLLLTGWLVLASPVVMTTRRRLLAVVEDQRSHA
ncbi:MAG TPA: choice-of-anchor P family protein, partial [Acidimicrobiales bacterium]